MMPSGSTQPDLSLSGTGTEGDEAGLLEQRIDAILPQTQCQQCGYAGCRPYAQAITSGEADIDQCPPGGDEGVRRLAALLNTPAKPLNRAHGLTKPPAVAWVDEALCIGCTLCIRACPVDAIVGASKLMHTVVAAECTGCELCIAPCPVDCIVMRPRNDNLDSAEKKQRADRARRRHYFRLSRLEDKKNQREKRLAAKQANAPAARPGTARESALVEPEKAAIAPAIESPRAGGGAVRREQVEADPPAAHGAEKGDAETLSGHRMGWPSRP